MKKSLKYVTVYVHVCGMWFLGITWHMYKSLYRLLSYTYPVEFSKSYHHDQIKYWDKVTHAKMLTIDLTSVMQQGVAKLKLLKTSLRRDWKRSCSVQLRPGYLNFYMQILGLITGQNRHWRTFVQHQYIVQSFYFQYILFVVTVCC